MVLLSFEICFRGAVEITVFNFQFHCLLPRWLGGTIMIFSICPPPHYLDQLDCFLIIRARIHKFDWESPTVVYILLLIPLSTPCTHPIIYRHSNIIKHNQRMGTLLLLNTNVRIFTRMIKVISSLMSYCTLLYNWWTVRKVAIGLSCLGGLVFSTPLQTVRKVFVAYFAFEISWNALAT